ncbi:MAG TPA: SAM-dependent methyltransferase [Acetobacteraceae bacterium]|nr:SAM-dependent methyltransferase [Acetobacteraceae bacterium]
MPDLSREQRRALDTAMRDAREAAEAGAADALRRLGVADAAAPAHLDEARRALRRRLREHARSLGDKRNADGTQGTDHLKEAAAYIQWHRLLFARFLLERHLLRDADNDLVSLADCRDEALRTGAGDEWAVAAAHTSRTLPGVFPADDPAEALTLAPEHARALRERLRRLPGDVFLADDSLGWTYQFWRSAEKKRVNDSQVKIGAAELPAVTQLFTEPYMVRFLLHNTLGAWWAGKVLAADAVLARDAATEDALRAACALLGYAWDYLRFVKDGETWRPAAGSFPGWPRHAAELAMLDPCCGSGHFLTEALSALAALRAREEGLTPANAVTTVLRDNLAGLEIDGRCVQIASFALALTAWRIGGPQSLPNPNVAWVGAPPPLPKEQFVALANGDAELRRGLAALHDLFVQAPLLGSLIEPVGGDLVDPVRVARIEDSIIVLVERMRDAEPERAEGAVAARGMADAAAILARKWVLQATNVPFLGARDMCPELTAWLTANFEAGSGDYATAMLQRMLRLMNPAGVIAAVLPQNWLFLGAYRELRRTVLDTHALQMVAYLGARAFETISGEVVKPAPVILSNGKAGATASFAAWDAAHVGRATHKADHLRLSSPEIIEQSVPASNPDSRISVTSAPGGTLLSKYASALNGMHGGDSIRFRQCFWEQAVLFPTWTPIQLTVSTTGDFSGREHIFYWKDDGAIHRSNAAARVQGDYAWGKQGITVSMMGDLPVTRYTGEKFDISCSPMIPADPAHLPAIWTFCSSREYALAVRRIDQALKVTNGTLVKIPFDLAHWQQVAREKYPNGLPEPCSDDPTQWLFHGHPRHAIAGTELHVALARLAGYRWPAETDPEMRLASEARARIAEAAALPPADPDGLVPLPPLLGQRALAERLRAFCLAAWGADWQPGTEAALVAATCERSKEKPPRELTLEAWLRGPAA